MLEAAHILARLDAAIRELLELRSEVAGAADEKGSDGDNVTTLSDDLAPDNLLDTHSAQERFGAAVVYRE